MLFAAFQARPALFRIAAIVLVSLAFAGCKKEQAGDAPAEGADAAATAGADAKPAVADKVSAMSAEQLREAAGQALRQQRLYAPAGDNAMEYYLALRDKQPSDPAVSSALTDLMPYALIATEQSIGRDDFEEAQRLYALMEKTDAKAPALPRLKTAITDGRAEAAKRIAAQADEAEETVARQAELEKQRIADQQKQQKEASERLAQEAERQAAAARAAQSTPARPEPAAPAPVTSAPAPQPASEPAPQRAAAAASNTLRPISLPSPSYPREAQRRRRSGEVEVEFTVGTDGTVTSSRVVHASPPRVFDREALAAVNRWRFQPVGSPVTTRRKIEFKPAD